MMRIIDLSHFLERDMPLYPGTAPPRLEETAAIERDGFRDKRISLSVHTGTHMDAPAHILSGAKTLDQLPVDTFFGKALLIHCCASGGQTIGLEALVPLADAVRNCSFVLIRTDWSRYWGTDRYYEGYPVLATEAARWLAEADLKGVGIDTLSVDPLDHAELLNHRILLGAGLIIVENLTGLAAVAEENFLFACLPLKIRDADGSPVRAVAVIP